MRLALLAPYHLRARQKRSPEAIVAHSGLICDVFSGERARQWLERAAPRIPGMKAGEEPAS